TNGACSLLGKVEEGRANVMEVGEKRMAGNSGLNVNSVSYSNGEDGYCWEFGSLTILVPPLVRDYHG
nr:hypothetical protein [Tanacetum cinerariifolium]